MAVADRNRQLHLHRDRGTIVPRSGRDFLVARFAPHPIFARMGQGHADHGGENVPRRDALEDFVSTVDSFQETIGRLNQRYRELEERYLEINHQLEATNRRLQQAAEENRRFGEYLDNILRGIDTGVAAVDEEGIVRFFNPAAERLLSEAGSPEPIGRRFSELFPEISARLDAASPQEAAIELRRTCARTAKELELSIHVLTIPRDHGTSGAVYVIHDLTAVRQTEQELSRLKTLAALGEMSATLAHEIRNPLTGIVGYCGLLLREAGPHKRWAEKIEEGVNRLDSLIMHMLEFARTPQLNRRPIHWRAFGEEIANAFESGVLKKRITLARRFPEQWPQSVGDASLLRQAVFNLLQNAAQAVGEGGQVDFQIAPADNQVVLEVADDGPGIKPELMDQVFRPFFTTREHGTGLGLAIARKIVEAHGGTIDVHSAPGRGARFRVVLPCRE